MPHLQITTKIGCTNACAYCPQGILIRAYKRKSNQLMLGLEQFKSYLDKIPPEVNIWFAGMCEPWLNPDCSEMILHAHNKGHKLCVFTTLVGMTLPDINIIESIPFGFFRIHLPSDSMSEKKWVNDNYLRVLDNLSKSKINTSFHCHGKNPDYRVRSILKDSNKTFAFRSLYQRSGNLDLKNRFNLTKKRGTIGCRRSLLCNVLLPNGDVLLCSNDYEMKHVLGNIASSSYESLFNADEFNKILIGQQDDAVDILCRYCENFCYDVDIAAKIFNLPYRIDKCMYYLSDLNHVSDLKMILQKGFNHLKKKFIFN